MVYRKILKTLALRKQLAFNRLRAFPLISLQNLPSKAVTRKTLRIKELAVVRDFRNRNPTGLVGDRFFNELGAEPN
jgi:hypothetical protein